ncbi:MAG: hypothetical protein A3I66_15040 [Burkholderiales bacterium RIFCSPLOWO2_02_FULL_57_36]|nr:MAG: hypothetical protein A3I66_15040 [Burkholderiales bacterium RIFCSPLOWO2_02_FULL_57_36]
MASVHYASRFSAIVAAVSGTALTYLYHRNSGWNASLVVSIFGVLAGMVAYGLVYWVSFSRLGKARPILGWWRGSAIGLGTFLIVVMLHTAFFPGHGGFFVSLAPVLLIGIVMFGWAVAIVGACVGAFCERQYFA